MLEDRPHARRFVEALPFTLAGSVLVAVLFDWFEGSLASVAVGVGGLAVASAAARVVKSWMFDRAGVGRRSGREGR